MKKWLFVFVGILFVIGLVCADVRINEVMADPNQCYQDVCEWIEIYADSSRNLTNWTIDTDDEQNTNFSFHIIDYLIITKNKSSFIQNWSGVDENKVIEWTKMSLRNTNDSVFLFDDNSDLISNFTYLDSTAGKSWQFYDDIWQECEPTPSSPNSCEDNGNDDPEEIYLEFKWNKEDIINGKEFEIEITAENLDDNEDYDIKVWIEFKENNTIISQTYNENDEWVSSNQDYNKFFKKVIDETEDITLRIHKDYEDFSGDARIFFKLEGEDKISKNIKILEYEDEEETTSETTETTGTPTITGNVIKLGSSSQESETEDIKTQGNMIYQSKGELVKKYAIYGFTLLCVGLIVFLIFRKIK